MSEKLNEAAYRSPNISLEFGDTFKTNTVEVLEKLPGFWLAEDTEYSIDDINHEDGTCDVSWYNKHEHGWYSLNDYVGDITLEDMNEQCNMPGAIVEYNDEPLPWDVSFNGGWFADEPPEEPSEPLEEGVTLTEVYRGVDPTDIKKLVFIYVLQNGYSRAT